MSIRKMAVANSHTLLRDDESQTTYVVVNPMFKLRPDQDAEWWRKHLFQDHLGMLLQGMHEREDINVSKSLNSLKELWENETIIIL